jgi:Caspase domain/PDZ domain
MVYLAMEDYSKAAELHGENPLLGVGLKDQDNQVRITQVHKNGPAYLAGMKKGDILVSMNGVKQEKHKKTSAQIKDFSFGGKTSFVVKRGGQKYKGYFIAGLFSDLKAKNDSLPGLVLIDKKPVKTLMKKEQPVIASPVIPLNKNAFGKYHALIIGNNEYQYISKLKSAVGDAEAVAGLLETHYGFKVQLLVNASRSDILMSLSRYRKTLTESDSLLIYYAGHGWLDDQADRGYWLPVNAENGNNVNWVSNASVTDAIRAIQARHVMLVADSCYSGKLTRGINLTSRDAGYLDKISKKRSRTVLTSGGLEPVDDSGGGAHSVFAKAFIDVLQENEGVLDGHMLFTKIRRPILLNSDQTPEYGDIRKVGHDGGDFVFVRQ